MEYRNVSKYFHINLVPNKDDKRYTLVFSYPSQINFTLFKFFIYIIF